jgi:hypothetical protein
MKKLYLFIALTLFQYISFACPVCERNKPKILRGITHGSSPEGFWDYAIVVGMILIVIAALYLTIKWLIKPNENNKEHIKYSFLNQQ